MKSGPIPNGAGDCEDYVLEKRRELMHKGLSASDLLITVVRKPDGEGHAMLTVRTDKGDFVLDNLTDAVAVGPDRLPLPEAAGDRQHRPLGGHPRRPGPGRRGPVTFPTYTMVVDSDRCDRVDRVPPTRSVATDDVVPPAKPRDKTVARENPAKKWRQLPARSDIVAPLAASRADRSARGPSLRQRSSLYRSGMPGSFVLSLG